MPARQNLRCVLCRAEETDRYFVRENGRYLIQAPVCLALAKVRRQAKTKKEKERREDTRVEGEVDRSSCPSRCQRQIIVLTLSELLRPRRRTPLPPSPDYSLVDGIAAASSTSSSSLCPPREMDFQAMSDHLNKTWKRGRGIEERVAAKEEEEGGRGTFEVRSTRLTGVDQISEGEIIQGRRRRDRDKAPLHGLTISERSASPLFFYSFSLLSRPLVSRLIRLRSARANSEVDPKGNPLGDANSGARGLWRVSH